MKGIKIQFKHQLVGDTVFVEAIIMDTLQEGQYLVKVVKSSNVLYQIGEATIIHATDISSFSAEEPPNGNPAWVLENGKWVLHPEFETIRQEIQRRQPAAEPGPPSAIVRDNGTGFLTRTLLIPFLLLAALNSASAQRTLLGYFDLQTCISYFSSMPYQQPYYCYEPQFTVKTDFEKNSVTFFSNAFEFEACGLAAKFYSHGGNCEIGNELACEATIQELIFDSEITFFLDTQFLSCAEGHGGFWFLILLK